MRVFILNSIRFVVSEPIIADLSCIVNVVIVIVITARPCSTLTTPAHGTWSSLTGSYGSRVQLMCDTGYVLIGGNSSTSIDCLANGTWSNSDTTSLTCNGKLIIQSKVIQTIHSTCVYLEGMMQHFLQL
jgi:hypothetical protein